MIRKEITREEIEESLNKSITNNSSRKLVIYAIGYIDQNNNIRCGFLEEFDRVMKEEFNKIYDRKR